MTHRDPAKVVPSWASMVSTIFPTRCASARPAPARPRGVEHLREGMQHAIAARARIGEDRFLDVHHRELVADPMGTVRRVYDFLGLELTPTVEQTIADWQEDEPVRRQGYAPLHRRAVRPERRTDPRRLRLLHPPLRRRVEWKRMTTPSDGPTAELGRPDEGARRASATT